MRLAHATLHAVKKEWCTNTTGHRRYLPTDLELLHIKCRPHYLPKEINVLNLFAVYIPPDANTKSATTILKILWSQPF